MNAVIYYDSKYGSTEEYARWIAEDTALPITRITGREMVIDEYDFYVLVTPIYFYKPLILEWLARNLETIGDRPVVLVTVSGAGPGEKLEGWLRGCLPPDFLGRAHHIGLRGRQNPRDLNVFHWIMLKIAALFNSDADAARDEAQGFDHVDRASIAPVVAVIEDLKARAAA